VAGEGGGGASLFMRLSGGQSTHLCPRVSQLSSLPSLLRMNPGPCVRHQGRAKESPGQKQQACKREKIKERVQLLFIGCSGKTPSVLMAFKVLNMSQSFNKRYNYA